VRKEKEEEMEDEMRNEVENQEERELSSRFYKTLESAERPDCGPRFRTGESLCNRTILRSLVEQEIQPLFLQNNKRAPIETDDQTRLEAPWCSRL
jgi:hypothetical protein